MNFYTVVLNTNKLENLRPRHFGSFSEIESSTDYSFYTILNVTGFDDPDAPIHDASKDWWFNVLQFGIRDRLTQIAFMPYFYRETYNKIIFVRQKHDNVWSAWGRIVIQ